MTERQRIRKENAREYARRVIVEDFGQNIDEETLDSVADKLMRSLPDYEQEKHAA